MNRALASAKSAVATGRIGLPWNVQADLFVSGTAPVDADQLLTEVRELVGLDVVRTVTVDAGGDITVLCVDFERNLTATLAYGPLPAAAEPAGTTVVHRYRISGSHGFLLVDATRPAVDIHTRQGVTRRWADT